jgi:hypothetical protein
MDACSKPMIDSIRSAEEKHPRLGQPNGSLSRLNHIG